MAQLYEKVCITGMGMVTALGLDVNTSCAAARAGISRAQELEYFPVRSLENGAVSDVIGHNVPEITRGFEGNARLLRLMQAGLADLQRQVPRAPWKSAPTAFYLSLPTATTPPQPLLEPLATEMEALFNTPRADDVDLDAFWADAVTKEQDTAAATNGLSLDEARRKGLVGPDLSWTKQN